MIHKIKGLYDQGRGLSVRAISRELGISRNTVRKYLHLDEVQISAAIADPSRTKVLDEHRDYLINQLGQFPALSAVKLARRLRERTTDLAVSDRSIRRYVQALKQQVASGQLRYYEPVVESVPGVQCQVDPGELRGVMIGGLERVIHFVVFVLSCSRLMYVGLDFRPLDTERFIQMHDEAFRYFGGVTEECIYDQTKMVVINEQYRELTLNSASTSMRRLSGTVSMPVRAMTRRARARWRPGSSTSSVTAFTASTSRMRTPSGSTCMTGLRRWPMHACTARRDSIHERISRRWSVSSSSIISFRRAY